MKKYLLFIISMLCVSIGTWADPTPFYEGAASTYEISSGTITLNINASGEIDAAVSDWQKWNYGGNMPSDIAAAKTAGFTTLKIITAANVAMTSGDGEGLYAFGNNYQVLDLSQATVTLNYGKVRLGGITNRACQPNIIVPAAYSSAPGTFPAANQDGNSITGGVNLYSIDGTTVNAAMNNSTVTTALTNISSTATRMKIMNEVDAIDLRSVITSAMVTELSPSTYTIDLMDITTVSSGSNDITVIDGVKVICSSSGVKSRIKGTAEGNVTVVSPVISCTAGGLSGELTTLASYGVAPTSITITGGELTTEQMTNFGTLEGLTYLSLQDANDTNIGSLALPTSLEALTLPKNDNTKASVTDAMKAHANLKYIYSPTSDTQSDAEQFVADYVWVNKPGGLWQAFENEAYLRTAIYMKIASTVPLNGDDMNFNVHGEKKPTEYLYLDLSDANLTPAVAAQYRVTDELAYRIILPNDWTGDMMAVFASMPFGYRGNIAAVYSYTGTDHKRLDILEIEDHAYSPNALHDARIVREGTEAVRVISGSHNGTMYSKFGPNLLAAINAADDTPGDNTTNHITKVTVAVGDGIYTAADAKVSSATPFTFDNDNLTNLDLSYTNNSYVTIDVSGCAGLTNFQMNEATVAAVNASGINGLATVSLGHTTVGGDVDLSNTNSTNTSLTSDLEVDLANIGGTLNVSGTNATSFDFSKLTAESVDASGTTALTSLNLNGIKLNGMPDSGTDAITQTNIDNRIGTVEVTRSGNNYSGLNIITASAAEFAPNRIVPSNGNYTRTAIEPAHIEISAAGSSLNTTVPPAVTAYNTAHASDDGYTPGNEANVQILHVTGELTDADITYIKTNLTALQLLDLSGCTYAAGLSDLVDKIKNAPIPTSTAIVLPGTSNTEEGTIANVMALQDAGYECVAYYTSKEEDDYRLNIYAYNGTVGNLKSTNPAIIDSNTGITLLPRYTWDSYTSQYVYQFTQAQPSLLTALGTLPPFSIDMTWLDISKLGVNFSGLNNDTHYLIIPQNTIAAYVSRYGTDYNNDFTVETGGAYVNYQYNSNVYAVSTYKSTATPYATLAYFDGEAYQYGPGVGYGQVNNTANITYLRKPGNLGTVMPYMSTELKTADILTIVGTIDSEDLVQYETTTSLSDATNKYLDLTHATFATTGDNPITANSWSAYSNSSVESIAMPYGYSSTLAGLPTVGTCANLKGIGCLLKSDDVYESSTKKSTLVYQSYKEGGVGKIIPMLHALNLGNRAYRITSLTVGGPVNACDLANRSTGIDENGHLITSVDANNVMTVTETGNSGSLNGYAGVMDYWDLSKVTLPNYNTRDGKSYCFSNSDHTYTTSDATVTDGFSYQNDLCFSKIGLVPDRYDPFSCELPTDASVWRLPTDAFYNGHGMTELNLPFNYQYIGNGAFTDTYLTHITTTDAIINGNIVDNGEHTYTLSANLKEIGDNPGEGKALDANQTVFPQNREVYDVYVLATDVPKCYANAFAANVLYGWGGFQGSFPYCRDKYINGSNWFCVLRYPYKAAWEAAHPSPARQTDMEFESDDDEPIAGVQKAPASRRAAPSTTPDLATIDNYEEMEAAYTDVYKIYTKKEQTGAVDANGNAILWPTFSELQRVSAQALTNEVWHDWDTAYDGQQEVNTSSSYNSGTYTKSIDTNTSKHYDFEEYKGWHQFVLTQATYVESVEQNATEREYEQKGWYTFCIPYDLTEDQVYEMLGVPYSTAQYTNKVGDNRIKKSDESTGAGVIDRILPDIRTLKQVERTPGTPNVVSLRLTDNLTGAISGKYSYWSVTNSTTKPTSNYVECGTKGDPNAVVIKGGYPYYIQPYLLKGETVKNLGKYVMSRYGDKFKKTASCVNHDITMEYLGDKDAAPEDRLATLKFAKPLEEHKIWAKYDDNDDSNDPYEFHDKDNDIKYNYTFVGQFWDQKLPRYCYYTMEGTGNWYRLAANKNYTWNAYKCVIMATQEVDDTDTHPQSGKFRKNSGEVGEIISFYPTIATGTTDLLDDALRLAFLDGLDDYDFGSSSARRYMFTFDDVIMDSETDGQVTAIETLDGNSIVPATGKVYNMAGQHVGNSLESLPKGMYIANGKKVIVK